MEVPTSKALVAFAELAALYQQSSPVELLQNFQAMGQLNFPAKNRHRWLATNRHISPLLAHRH
jgi:hypothetical protein